MRSLSRIPICFLVFAAIAPDVVRAGRNESECVQLVLLLGEPLAGASVAFSEFTTREGTIAASAWSANLIAQVPGLIPQRAAPMIKTWAVRTGQTRAAEDTPGAYSASASGMVPDALLRDVVFDLGRGLNRIWLSVRVPKDARPGDYSGVVRVRDDVGRMVIEIPLSLRVWDHVLPDEPSLMVMANVWSNRPPAGAAEAESKSLWEHLKPYYDDLKAHRVEATGEIYPARAWDREQPPPDLREYERALSYVLDDLGFQRFRLPGVTAVASGTWLEMPVFQRGLPQRVADGVWISGAAFVQSFPATVTAQWTRVAGQDPVAAEDDFGGATIAGYADAPPAWVEYSFESSGEEKLAIWLQVDATHAEEKKLISIDGREIGALTGDDFLKNPLGFARLNDTIKLEPGAHALRITVENVVGSVDPIYGIFITANQNPDLELVLRERGKLDERFRRAFDYHARQMGGWLKERKWLRKAHAKLKDEPGVGEYGRVASVYDFVGQVLPSIRREISENPTAMLRKSAEVWTVNLAGPRFDSEGWTAAMKPTDELWAQHNFLHTLGYPSIAMRMIPWTLGRHGIKGYQFWSVNYWAADPWTDTNQKSTFMRGTLIYPDPKTGEPVNSVRWELFREGLEDFETLRLLRTACDEAAASPNLDETRRAAIAEAEKLLGDEVGGVVRNARDFSWDPVELEDLRVRACALLHVLAR
jgi:hypothetical protein